MSIQSSINAAVGGVAKAINTGVALKAAKETAAAASAEHATKADEAKAKSELAIQKAEYESASKSKTEGLAEQRAKAEETILKADVKKAKEQYEKLGKRAGTIGKTGASESEVAKAQKMANKAMDSLKTKMQRLRLQSDFRKKLMAENAMLSQQRADIINEMKQAHEKRYGGE